MANRILERAEFDENIDIGDHDELFIQGIPGSSVSLLCYLGQEFQYFERFSYLRLCSSVRYRESEHNQRLFQISAEELPELS